MVLETAGMAFVATVLWTIALVGAIIGVIFEGDKPEGEGIETAWKKQVGPKKIVSYHFYSLILVELMILLVLAVLMLLSVITPKELTTEISMLLELVASILTTMTIPKVLPALPIIRSFFAINCLLLLSTLFQGFLWNFINPSPKFGVRNFAKNYNKSVETAILLVVTYVAAILIGIREQWFIAFEIMLALTVFVGVSRYLREISGVYDQREA